VYSANIWESDAYIFWFQRCYSSTLHTTEANQNAIFKKVILYKIMVFASRHYQTGIVVVSRHWWNTCLDHHHLVVQTLFLVISGCSVCLNMNYKGKHPDAVSHHLNPMQCVRQLHTVHVEKWMKHCPPPPQKKKYGLWRKLLWKGVCAKATCTE
jgi:hypothetical protein